MANDLGAHVAAQPIAVKASTKNDSPALLSLATGDTIFLEEESGRTSRQERTAVDFCSRISPAYHTHDPRLQN